VPAVKPITIPSEAPTTATKGALLLHVPPGILSTKVVVVLMQIVGVPDIVPAEGAGFTVIIEVTTQPLTPSV
jgi:hypothetical protein